jgi:hypothetical protein
MPYLCHGIHCPYTQSLKLFRAEKLIWICKAEISNESSKVTDVSGKSAKENGVFKRTEKDRYVVYRGKMHTIFWFGNIMTVITSNCNVKN